MPATATKKKTATQQKKKTTTRRTGKQPIQADDLLKFHFISDPQISPDGRNVVFVKKHVGEKKSEYVNNLWLVPAEGAEPQQFTNGGKDAHPRWSPDGRTIAFISARDKHKPQIYTIPATGGEATALTDFPEGTIATFKWSPSGDHLAVQFRENDPDWTQDAKKKREKNGQSEPPRVLDHWWYRLDGDGYFNGQRFALYRVDAKTGEHKKIYDKDRLGLFSFDFSPDGKKIVIGSNRDKKAGLRAWNDDLLLLDVNSRKTTPIKNLPNGPKDHVLFSPDGKYIAYAGREGEDSTYSTENLELWVCDINTGKARSLTGNTDYCLMATALTDSADVKFGPNIRWSADSKRIYMNIGWHGENHIASAPVRGGEVTFHTSGKLDHQMGSISRDGRTMALTIGKPDALPEVHVAPLNGQSSEINTTPLTTFNAPLFKKRKVSKPTSHWIKAEDGHPVQVWCIKPPEYKSNKKYPAILEIHGGPHAQYGVAFFHEMQLLAGEGYVVFLSNPRGSKGYGRDHCAAIRGAWGGDDWRDVKAVTEYMKSRPFVDTKRMGVMGGSYGGYMTLWTIGHTNDFKAAISDRCVSNLHSMAGSSDFVEVPDQYFPGNAWDKPEALWDSSPLKHIGKVKTPTLLIHSEGDLRCNVEQAEQVFSALQVRGVASRFVRYPRSTSHGLSRSGPPDLRLHRLEHISNWWKNHLK